MIRLFAIVLLGVVCSAPVAAGVPAGAKPATSKVRQGQSPGAALQSAAKSRYVPDRVVVKLRAGTAAAKTSRAFGVAAIDAYAQTLGASSIERIFPHASAPADEGIDLTGYFSMRFTSPRDAFSLAEELSRLPDVQYAEPVFLRTPSDVLTCTPNDTGRHSQWNLNKILADTAFCITQGDTSVIIGIVDTGVQTDHPDLAPNIWHNPGETGLDGLGRDKRSNGVDDDADGYVDDWQGWDFGGANYLNPVGDNDPTPKNLASGHGTHVAGVASAATNNTTGIASIGNKSRMLVVKTGSDNDIRGGGEPLIVFGNEGIVYAVDRGAKIINCSWGGPEASQFEQDIVNYATSHGALVIAAAGNGSTGAPEYPAAYDNVLSVAASNVSDKKPAYSNYGTTIDVCAPGGDPNNDIRVAIYSTDYPSTYGLGAGTSFSSPLVAGLAALVKSANPGLSPIQVGEQIRVTCDDMDAGNPFYARQLGKGRINAFRALTQSFPSVRMLSFSASDSATGNNNGSLEPNEVFTLTANVINYLQSTSPGAVLTLTSADTSVTILSSLFSLGSVATFGTASNASQPFQVQVKSNPAKGQMVKFTLLIDDGTYHDFQSFFVLINPTFATHTVNNVHVTLTNNGRIGFNDFPDNTQGVGFAFKGVNQLFEGGLLIGLSATKLVDVVRDTLGNADADFVSGQIFTLRTPGDQANQEGLTSFTDSAADTSNRIGLQVTLRSYEFTSPQDSNFVILRYDLKNISGADLTNVHAGIFFDWDVLPDFNVNRTDFDATRGMGYAWDNSATNPIYCAATALDGASGYRGMVNSATLDLSRAGKWSWLSGGIVKTDSIADIHFTVSSGPYSIASGATQSVGFAMLAGTSLEDLQRSADASAREWTYLRSVDGRPQAAQLLFPPDGQTSLRDTVLLRWSTAFGAVSYRAQVATDTAFANLVIDDSLGATSTFVTVPFPETTYYWRIQSLNGSGVRNTSVVGTFATGIPLTISLPILQNPVLSQYADLIAASNLPLAETPTMTLRVGGGPVDTIPLTSIAPQIYKGSFEFTSSGGVVIRLMAKRLNGAVSTTQRAFVVQLLKRGMAGTIASVDHSATLLVSAQGAAEDTYYTIVDDTAPAPFPARVGKVYAFGPAHAFPAQLGVALRFEETPEIRGKERFLHLFRHGPSGWIPIESRVNVRTRTVSAPVTALGTFSIGYDERSASELTPTAYALSQNFPNPFNPVTTIRYALPVSGRVRLRVFNVMGQEIVQLVDGERAEGTYEEVWPGRTATGAEAASGVYFYRLEVTEGAAVTFTKTQKMLLLK